MAREWGESVMGSSEIYRLVGEQTGSLKMAAFAAEIVEAVYDDPQGVSEFLVAWGIRMSQQTYADTKRLASFNEDAFAKVFVDDESIDGLSMLVAFLSLGRALLTTLTRKEGHLVDEVSSEFLRRVAGTRAVEDEMFLKDTVRISLGAILKSGNSTNNHWAQFVMPISGYGMLDGNSSLMVSWTMLLRTRSEAEELGLLED